MVLESLTAALGLQGWFGTSSEPMSSPKSAAKAAGCDDGPQLRAFSDFAFEDVLKQMENPDLTGFELFADTRGVQIHRRLRDESGLYEYKVVGTQANVNPRLTSLVNCDLEYRKKWDKYVSQLNKIKEYSSGLQLLYWQVAYPFPMTNRDYFYYRQTRAMTLQRRDGTTQPAWVTISESAPPNPTLCPETKAIRVDDYLQTMAITADDEGTGSRLYIHSFDNPKGSIPSWLINYFAGSGTASYLDSAKKAAENYKE